MDALGLHPTQHYRWQERQLRGAFRPGAARRHIQTSGEHLPKWVHGTRDAKRYQDVQAPDARGQEEQTAVERTRMDTELDLAAEQIVYDDFDRVDIRVGRIV